jgi:hypothetical protein
MTNKQITEMRIDQANYERLHALFGKAVIRRSYWEAQCDHTFPNGQSAIKTVRHPGEPPHEYCNVCRQWLL